MAAIVISVVRFGSTAALNADSARLSIASVAQAAAHRSSFYSRGKCARLASCAPRGSSSRRFALVRTLCHQPKNYVSRRTADGKTKNEILRCLKRYIGRAVYGLLGC
jgi:hypothetical protein